MSKPKVPRAVTAWALVKVNPRDHFWIEGSANFAIWTDLRRLKKYRETLGAPTKLLRIEYRITPITKPRSGRKGK